MSRHRWVRPRRAPRWHRADRFALRALRKPAQFPGRCVFCNGLGMTKEHIWSDWITKRGLVPGEQSHGQVVAHTHFNDKEKIVTIDADLIGPKLGALIQRKIRNVCVGCNTGWMRDVVNAAISISEKLILGRSVTLDPKSQTQVATWITIACIMAEFTDERSMAILPYDRDFVRKHRFPPDNWRIFIGRYSGSDWTPTRYRHHGSGPIRFQSISGGLIVSRIDCFQVTTYILGNFAVHAFSSRNSEISFTFDEQFSPCKMLKIWPVGSNIEWPPDNALNDDEIMSISNNFWFANFAKHRPM